jgi:hypothetical protein
MTMPGLSETVRHTAKKCVRVVDDMTWARAGVLFKAGEGKLQGTLWNRAQRHVKPKHFSLCRATDAYLRHAGSFSIGRNSGVVCIWGYQIFPRGLDMMTVQRVRPTKSTFYNI